MTTDVIKYGFIAGEISPSLFGRGDLTKYDLAMAEARNFYVDYRGGLATRPGTEFCDFISYDDEEYDVKLFVFHFAPDLSNNYLMLFGRYYVRFIQDGAYVLETEIVIIDIAKPGGNLRVTTSGAHGYSTGDWVRLWGVEGMTEVNNRTFQVFVIDANEFDLYILPGVDYPDTDLFTNYVSDGKVARIYTVVTPYNSDKIAGLTVTQYRDLVRITHVEFAPQDLTRNDHTDWSFGDSTTSTYAAGPTITSFTPSAAGAARAVFAVTKILADGSESTSGPPKNCTSLVNYTATAGDVIINWSAASDALYYNIYRSVVTPASALYEGTDLGYAGKTFGTSFVDPNIIPDFTKNPPLAYNPFDPGAITEIIVTAGGSGYTNFGATVSIAGGGGSGFVGQVVTNASGAVVNVIIKNPGSGYSSPVVTFGGGGTLATATATARELTGTYPALSAIFQQRQIYAASLNKPITIWGSQIKRFGNFNNSTPVIASDAFEFDLDTTAIAPIKHIFSARGGLIAMTQENVFLLSGGSNGEALTPTNALAEPQSYSGVTDLRPLTIGTDILYAEGKGIAVRMLSYSDITKVYGGVDRSLLSNHLFGKGKALTSWAYQESPNRVVWTVREDGSMLAFTIVTEEEIYAWTPCETYGKFKDAATVQENNRDAVYFVVQRYINGRWSKYIERLADRDFTYVEDSWCVDAGMTFEDNYPDSSLILSYRPDQDVWAAEAEPGVDFHELDGAHLYVAGGVFIVNWGPEIPYITGLTLVRTPELQLPNNGGWAVLPYSFGYGDWALAPAITEIGGLHHLEGQEVSILGDGNVMPPQTVVNGNITIPDAASRIIVGLPYTCRAKTLPMIIPNAGIEGRRKRITGLAVRRYQSRGLLAGPSLDRLYPIRERTYEDFGEPTALQNNIKYQFLPTDWNEEGQIYFVVTDPLPTTLLSLALDLEVGDEKD